MEPACRNLSEKNSTMEGVSANDDERAINFIVIHCSDTYARMDIDADTIRAWHINERGWDDIGYHYVIKRNGAIEEGRPVSEVGAHVRGYNSNSIGVCLVGGKGDDDKPENNFTQRQMQSLRDLCLFLVEQYPKAMIVGHNDLDSGKTCPNFPVFELAKWVNIHSLNGSGGFRG